MYCLQVRSGPVGISETQYILLRLTFLVQNWVSVGVEQSQLDQTSDTVGVTLYVSSNIELKKKCSKLSDKRQHHLVSQGSPEDGVGGVDAVKLGVDGAVSVRVS